MRDVRAPSELMNLKSNLFSEVVKQLEKDFALSGVSIDWSVDIKPDKMWLDILSKLDNLLRNDPEALRNLLYRVDLDEKNVTSSLVENEKNDFVVELAKQLVVREIQKILNRQNYRLD